jgi:tyrosine decarboxylase/aspartate 1-decarboxylase
MIIKKFNQVYRMKRENNELELLGNAVKIMKEGFSSLPDFVPQDDWPAIEVVLKETAERLKDNYPYFHPLYAGQMLKPPHPVARLAYMLAMWINPNNHALDGGRASSQMEKEAVSALADMFGWSAFLGHLTSGGTMANLEALWVAGKCTPGKKIVASEQAHYTHQRISAVLQLDFQSVRCEPNGRMDISALEELLKEGSVGTVVATAGTTGTGSVDPLSAILRLREVYGLRLHVDAAYGGYFVLADTLAADTRREYDLLQEADSIVIDPHKHGLQPYGCGCVLFKDPGVGALYKHDSPYTYFSSDELHLGEISLECSRAGASAVALWATQKLLPMKRGGEFAHGLECCHAAALALHKKVSNDPRFKSLFKPELDIVVWAPEGSTASDISCRSQVLFEKAAKMDLHLATFKYPSKQLQILWPEVEFDQEYVTCLRSCLMKPEHADWLERIWEILGEAFK